MAIISCCKNAARILVIFGSVLLASPTLLARASPTNDLNKGQIQEGVVLPDGYELTRCARIASQIDSRLLVCTDTNEEPVLLTISAIKDFPSFNARNRLPLQGKYLISPRTSHFVPSFLRRCSPAQATSRQSKQSDSGPSHTFFDCLDGSNDNAKLRVGVAHHLLRDKRWIEVVVKDRHDDNRQLEAAGKDGQGQHQHATEGLESDLAPADEHESETSNKDDSAKGGRLAGAGERNDCIDEHDPNCDLESARDEDN